MASERSAAAAAITAAGEVDGRTSRTSIADDDTIAPSSRLPEEARNPHSVGPGSIIAGKYRVNRIIGKGGMGLVVEARHLQLDSIVAIKLLFPEFMSYTEATERFLREARAASRLESQHVTRVLDVGTLGAGEPFMVMECLAGEDLSSYLKNGKGPIAIHDAIDFIAQACDAIGEAHEQNIVHRDIKPANLFLTSRAGADHFIKVLDFGISKVLGEGGQERDVQLTQTTMILGSALYMSPEQMQSAKKVDRRTDIYALGVCLFELIGHEVPYFADSFPELCAKVYTSPPRSLRELRPDTPEGLIRVIERALAHRAEDRYQRVGEFVQALSPYARPDTRRLIEGILRRRAPGLELLLPADGSTERDAKTAPRPEEKKESRKPVFFWLPVVLAALGATAFVFRAEIPGYFARLRGTSAAQVHAEQAPEAAPPPAAVTVAPVATADPIAPAPNSVASAAASANVAPSTSASANVAPSAAPVASAAALPTASAIAKPVLAGRHGPAPHDVVINDSEQPLAPPKDLIKTPGSPQKRELTEEHCFTTIDGVRKEVPCN